MTEDPSLLRRHYHSARTGLRDIEHEFAGVLGRAHDPDRGGCFGQWVISVLRGRQLSICY